MFQQDNASIHSTNRFLDVLHRIIDRFALSFD